MGRNEKGEGGVYKYGDAWRGYITVHGKRREFRATTKSGANAKRKALIALRDAGLDVNAKWTVDTWLEHWLTTGVAWAPRYRDTQTYIVRAVLSPALGPIPLAELRPEHVEQWIAALMASKGPKGKRLSAATVRRYHATLHGALKAAEGRGHLVRNAAALVALPKLEKTTTTSYSVADTRAILEASRGTRMEARWMLALMLGLRPAEALGLTWDSIDLDAGRLTVRQQIRAVKGGGFELQTFAKTDAGHRTLHLPAPLAESLRRHRDMQTLERLDSEWVGWDHDLVFCSLRGTPIGDGVDTRAWRHVLDVAGLPHVRRYQARHTAATIQLKQSKQDVAVVAKNLGHTDPGFTYRTYIHPLEDAEAQLAREMAELFGA